MNFLNKVLIAGLLVVISQMSASDARAGGRSRTELGELEITAPVARQAAGPGPACADEKPGCIDCTTKGKCDAGATELTPNGTCPAGEACIVVGSTPVCKPIAETNCNCGGGNQGCDAFAVNQPIFCIAGNVYMNTPCASGEKCSGAGNCVSAGGTAASSDPVNSNTSDTPEYIPVTQSCTFGVFCDEKPLPSSDSATTTTTPATDSPTTDSLTTDSPTTDSPTTDSPTTDSPTTDSPTTVPTITTTADPSTCSAADVAKRYPHETDCHRYYECSPIGQNRFAYVEKKCLRNFIFNPTYTFCDFPRNGAGCEQ